RRHLSASGRLRRSNSTWRETGRPAGAGRDQTPAGDQPQDRQGIGPYNSAISACPCRRGDRINLECPLLALSRHSLPPCTCPLSGVKRTSFELSEMSANDPKRTLVGCSVIRFRSRISYFQPHDPATMPHSV